MTDVKNQKNRAAKKLICCMSFLVGLTKFLALALCNCGGEKRGKREMEVGRETKNDY